MLFQLWRTKLFTEISDYSEKKLHFTANILPEWPKTHLQVKPSEKLDISHSSGKSVLLLREMPTINLNDYKICSLAKVGISFNTVSLFLIVHWNILYVLIFICLSMLKDWKINSRFPFVMKQTVGTIMSFWPVERRHHLHSLAMTKSIM